MTIGFLRTHHKQDFRHTVSNRWGKGHGTVDARSYEYWRSVRTWSVLLCEICWVRRRIAEAERLAYHWTKEQPRAGSAGHNVLEQGILSSLWFLFMAFFVSLLIKWTWPKSLRVLICVLIYHSIKPNEWRALLNLPTFLVVWLTLV